MLCAEEPDELIAHVRICGGAGWVTAGPTRIAPSKPEALGFPQGGMKFAIVAQWVRFGCEPSPT